MPSTRPPGHADHHAPADRANRGGAHRERPPSLNAYLTVAAGSTVVLLALGGVYTVVTGRTDNAPAGGASASLAALDEEPAEETGAGAASDEASDSALKPAGSDPGEPAGKVDKLTPVAVLNSLSINGLASTYKEQLEGKGWTVSRTDNAPTPDLPVTQIYYDTSEAQATAKAVRKALGGLGEVAQSDEFTGITVVLGQDTQ